MSWSALDRTGPEAVTVAGVELRPGSRVRLRPRGGTDIWARALAGRTAVVDAVLEDTDGARHLAVVVDDDPGRDLGAERGQPGHRFFFAPEEVEPVRRVLVAGIGNVFLGDDGWGVALAGRLAGRALPPGVEVADFGIRGLDLAYALHDGWDAVILLDAMPRGERPGTISVIEAEAPEGEELVDAHGMDPVRVLALAQSLASGPLPRTLVVGCEPAVHPTPEDDDLVDELSAPVRAGLDPAAEAVEALLAELIPSPDPEVEP